MTATITLPGEQSGDYSIAGLFFRDGRCTAEVLTVKQKYLITELLGGTIDGDTTEPTPASEAAPIPQPAPEPESVNTAEGLAAAGEPTAQAGNPEPGSPASGDSVQTQAAATSDTSSGDSSTDAGIDTGADSGRHAAPADPTVAAPSPAVDAAADTDATVTPAAPGGPAPDDPTSA